MIDFSKIQHFAFQSTLSVRRATVQAKFWIDHRNISIHALREESDGTVKAGDIGGYIISIHALREESDSWGKYVSKAYKNFNPRSP